MEVSFVLDESDKFSKSIIFWTWSILKKLSLFYNKNYALRRILTLRGVKCSMNRGIQIERVA